MTAETWLLYVGTVLLFMSTPGPSHLLMLSTSLSNGFRRSLATAAGDLSANAVQIILAGMGLAAVVSASRYGFTVIKWAGVSYLCGSVCGRSSRLSGGMATRAACRGPPCAACGCGAS